jgi:uncharacterized OsmC-like protein
MDREALRTLQAPLKQQYRDTPASASVTARAVGRLDVASMACVVETSNGETTAGLHPATGGSGALSCSADMLLEALVACAGVTLLAVATAMGIRIRDGRVIASGTWDARGTLAMDKTTPVGLTEIALRFELDTPADDAQIQRLIDTTERCCVILQTLRTPPRLSTARATARRRDLESSPQASEGGDTEGRP